MAGFPPKTGSSGKTIQVVDTSTTTTGNGGIKTSLKVKAAGTKPAAGAGPDKTVLSF